MSPTAAATSRSEIGSWERASMTSKTAASSGSIPRSAGASQWRRPRWTSSRVRWARAASAYPSRRLRSSASRPARCPSQDARSSGGMRRHCAPPRWFPTKGDSRGWVRHETRGAAAVGSIGVGREEDHPARRLGGVDVGLGARGDDRARSDDEGVPGSERDVTAVDAQDLVALLEVEEREEVVRVGAPLGRVRSRTHPVLDPDGGQSGCSGEVDERDGRTRRRSFPQIGR